MTAAPSEKKILVVEDEPDVQRYLCACLEDAGFRVESAYDGEEGLQKVREDPPDLVTLDMVMPRKSGRQFMKELRKDEKWANIPVIVITAHVKDEWGSQELKEISAFAARHRPKYVLRKPIKPSGLVQAIADILEVDPSAQEPQHSESLVDVVNNMLENADQETLNKVREMLSSKQSRGSDSG